MNARRTVPPSSSHKPSSADAPREIRLIGGRLKRSVLPVPSFPGLRPTPNRVRETLFNWLGHDLDGWRVLDAFAGTGALGLEAASRGAAEVVLLERESVLARHLTATVSRLKIEGVQVVVTDALGWMKRCATQHPGGRFDLIFLDPPFADDLFADAMHAGVFCVPVGGWLYLEASCALTPEQALSAGLRMHRHAQAGAVHYHLMERVDTGVGVL